jgi:integrase/recombinase XerD
MSALRTAAEDYLAMRRALGFKLSSQGRLLLSFVDYCEARHAEHVTTELAVTWATNPVRGGADQVWWSRRLMVVPIFARHLKTLDPATEIPPADVLPHHYRRVTPHLYAPEEIAALLQAAGRLAPPLRAATWQTFLGLLAVTGMRVSEACGLDRDHVDLDTGTLVLADTKFGKSRQVFLHPSSVTALRDYEQRRNRHCPAPRTPGFLVSTRGTRLDASNVQYTFVELLAAAGITARPGRRRPRLHDVRHSFSVWTLLEWYRDGGDVQARLPLLSTWLGHVDPKSTYWYLQAVPELLTLAADRLEHPPGESP